VSNIFVGAPLCHSRGERLLKINPTTPAVPQRRGLYAPRLLLMKEERMQKVLQFTIAAYIGFALIIPLTVIAEDEAVFRLAPGEWREIPDSKLKQVFPAESGHPAWGVIGPRAVTDAWGGAAYDTKRDMLVITGGGHTDYGGNEVYEFSLNNRKWSRVTEPSPITSVGGGKYTVSGSQAPVSSHTYDGLVYLPNVDRIFKAGGSYYGLGTSYDKHAYLFDPNQKTWKQGAEAKVTIDQPASDYDPKTESVVVTTNTGVMVYDPKNDSWKAGPLDDPFNSAVVGALNPSTRIFVMLMSGNGAVAYYDLNKLDKRMGTPIKGKTEWGPKAGMAFHPPSERMVVWNGGREVWTIDSANWSVEKLENSEGPAPDGARKTAGIYGRWQYAPKHDLFIGYVSTSDNVWLYKLAPQGQKKAENVSLPTPGAKNLPQAGATRLPPGGGKKRRTETVPCGADLCVGPDQAYKMPSEAAAEAREGQTVSIAAGEYPGDAAVWRQNNLTIRTRGGRAHLKADGAAAEGKGIWVIKGKNITIENIEFSGARVSDGNGAGIRLEGTNLTLRNCYFHDNQNGILTNNRNPASSVVIEHSEFDRNGSGDGRAHNIYVGTIGSFTLKHSYVHHAKVGHNVKSRAAKNYIMYNLIMDGADGTSSYAVDLPNGGDAYVIGNVIQKGPRAENDTLISYGAESTGAGTHPSNKLIIVNNTLINDRQEGGRFVFAKKFAQTVKLMNNAFLGKGPLLAGLGESIANLSLTKADFVNAEQWEYHLKASSRAVDAGQDPGEDDGFSLAPQWQYLPTANREPRKKVGTIDVGAYEYDSRP
jgi:hypothetical protein